MNRQIVRRQIMEISRCGPGRSLQFMKVWKLHVSRLKRYQLKNVFNFYKEDFMSHFEDLVSQSQRVPVLKLSV